MDNLKQVRMILLYKEYLTRMFNREVHDNEASILWCKYCAKAYREHHPFN